MECPFCAETVAPDDVDCPSCGEALDGDAASGGGGGLKTVLIVLGVIFFLCVVGTGVMAALLMPALTKAKEKANRTKCSNHLRMLGLGSLMYADDKRFYPHVAPLTELDGDVTTNHTPKKVRTLFYYGYLEDPEGLVCPSSFDMAIMPLVLDGRTWFWDGGNNPGAPDTPPLFDGAPDPTLDQTVELSYGTTRRGMNANVRSTAMLAADRAIRDGTDVGNPLEGNHEDGWNLLKVDATVEWISTQFSPAPGTWLTETDRSALSDPNAAPGYLDIKPNQ
jgi:hypothetical protein